MDQPPSVHNSPHLKHLGIDRNFIEDRAENMNKHFNKMYDDHIGKSSAVMPPPQQREQPRQGQPEPAHQHVEAQEHFAKQAQQLEQTFNGALQGLAQQFTQYTNELEQKLAQMQEKITQLEQRPVQQEQPAITPPQPTQREGEEAPMVDKTQEIPTEHKATTATHARGDEQLKADVAIDKMFNFSGCGKNSKRC